MVRAKFMCVMKRELVLVGESIYSIELSPVIDSAENKEFFIWTSSGNIELNNVNKCAADNLIVGKEYYVDFTEATLESCGG